MACYRFKIDGVDTQVSIPSSLKNDEDFNWETFISDLKSFTEQEKANIHTDLSDPDFIVTTRGVSETSVDKIVRLLDERKAEESLHQESINNIDKREAFELVKQHLKRIGVPVHIESQEKMAELGFPNNTDAGVLDGEIYLSEDSSISSPMHEFLHLVFGVMKYDKFKDFSRLMGLMSSVEEFNKIKQEIDTLPAYNGLTDLDKNEEAFARYMSELLDGRLQMSDEFNKIYDEVNRIMIPFIKTTFGIEGIINLMDFLNSPFSDLTKQGSTLFVKKSLDTTGYSDNKYKVVLSGKIMNYIKELSIGDNPLIQEGDCQ